MALLAEDYSSDFDPNDPSSRSAQRKRRREQDDFANKPTGRGLVGGLPAAKLPTRDFAREEYDRGERSRYMETSIKGLNAYEKHVRYVNNYVLWYGNGSELKNQAPTRSDYDIIEEEHRFVWTEEDESTMTWEKEQAHKYYGKLFKEYCIADLSRYKENRIAMRWRVEREVLEGKGHFSCGSLSCTGRLSLTSWEVNFKYLERGEMRAALVKLRLCPKCSKKLNYHRKHVQMEEEATVAMAAQAALENDAFRDRDRRPAKKSHKEKKQKKSKKHKKDKRPPLPSLFRNTTAA